MCVDYETVLIPFDDGWIELPRPQRPIRVTRLHGLGDAETETSHATWTWRDGVLHLAHQPDASPTLGFKVYGNISP